jgi:two-component system, cell cycle sensor histidine kinase and response regulator CckA
MAESVLHALLACVDHAIFVVDRQARVLYANPAAERLHGGTLDRAASWLSGVELSSAERQPLAENALPSALALSGEEVRDRELNWKNAAFPQGVPLLLTALPAREPGAQPFAAVIVLRDLGSHRRAEAEVTRARAFLDSIVENIPHMIFVKEAKTLSFELFNRAGEELLGMPRSALIGKNDFDFFPREQAEFFQARDRQTLNAGGLVDILEEPITTPNGERWLHTKKIPILDAKGEPQYLLGISEDITERKAAERLVREMYGELERRVAERTAELSRTNAELRQQIADRERAELSLRELQAQLLQAQKMEAVGRLAGGVAHDFNNMLSVILSQTDLAMADLPPAHPLREDLEQVHTAAQRAAQLTRQLLAYSRRQIMQPKVLDLNDVVRETEKMLRRLIGEDIELSVALAPELRPVRLDPGQIQQVLMNLVVNARDAMPTGGKLTLETANVVLDEGYARDHVGVTPGPHVMLAVSDTGIGMDRETQSQIFDPFFTTKTGEQGTGLGLSTVYGIVKQSGGHVLVYSEPGKGSTFKVYFPENAGSGLYRAVSAPISEHKGNETILLVEDEDMVRRAVHAILRRGGYQILEAARGSIALELAARHQGPIHLLITDVVMPELSGRELATRVSQLRPQTRILYMSGYTDNTIVHHGVLEAGVAFLQKPVIPDQLLRKVREVLDGR